jgi:GTP-binding protein HflX
MKSAAKADFALRRTRAIVVGVDFADPMFAERLDEAIELTTSAGAAVVACLSGRRQKPDAAAFAGSGKVDELAELCAEHSADLVVFNHALSPVQIRNVERRLQAIDADAHDTPDKPRIRVIDRTDLILDIFAQRAKSAEGKVEVELARLEHLMTRLVKGWTHLERQRGGIGVRGGPGETQLEIDRRLVGDRIKRLKTRLGRMEKQRQTQRGRRRRAGVYNVSIVGYTNAGKSTLFNRLARADTLVADQLFATLDTTTRKLYVDPGIHVTLSDTVGFIRDLPHSLVAAFEATLTEAREADLLLHVVDAANPLRETQIDDVNAVLADIGASAIPQVIVNNKIDRLEAHPVATALRDADGKIRELRVAALQRVGMDLIREAIREQAQVGGYPLNGHHHTEPHGESALQSHQDSPASA